MSDKNITRRIFLRNLAVAVPAAGVVLGNTAQAGDVPHIDEADPLAQGLAYVHDASSVDSSNPQTSRYEAGQHCANCALIQGDEGAPWRPCQIFSGKLVNANGWCSAWVPKV